jgi:nucleotide-binding universal stress UspA family protein
VMGRRSARNLRRAVLGSVTATVLGDPPCNVLVVPAA